MKLREEHLHAVSEFHRFKLTPDPVIEPCRPDRTYIDYVGIPTLQFIPGELIKLYVRMGMIVRLVTEASVSEINLAIELNASKSGADKTQYGLVRERVEMDSPPPEWVFNFKLAQRKKVLIGSGPNPHSIKRQMRMMLAPGSHTKQEWREVMRRDNWTCLRCGSKKSITKDHVKPIALGGSDSADNLQCLCRSCNSWKGARHIDFRANQPTHLSS